MTQEQVYSRIEEHFKANHERWVKRFNRYFKHQERAEDTVSETYTRALTYWENAPEDELEFEKWMRTILNNCGKNNHKEEMLHGATNKDELSDEQEAKEVSVIPSIISQQVTDLINSKEGAIRIVLKLALLEGWRPAQIKDIVDYKLSTIRDIIFEFRKEIREKFKWSV